QRLQSRDRAAAVRRLAARTAGKENGGRGRPRSSAAALKGGPAGLLQRSIALFLFGFGVATAITGNTYPLAALGAGAVLGMVPWLYVRRKGQRRVNSFEEQFPDCLEFISRCMRAGHAFSVAIEMAYREFSEPLAGELRRTFEEQNLGQPLEIVLRKL